MVEHEICMGCIWNNYPTCAGTIMMDGKQMNIDSLNTTFACGQRTMSVPTNFSIKRDTQVYEMRGFDGFIENDFGLVAAHSDDSAKVVFRLTPSKIGSYRFKIVFASTTLTSVPLSVRIGSWRVNQLFDAERYMPLTLFSANCNEINTPLTISSPVFVIDQVNEMIIVRLLKTSNSGTGNFYVLGGMLITE